MRSTSLTSCGTSLILAVVAILALPVLGDGPTKAKRKAIYDTKADGEAQIAEALSSAKRNNTRVLLQFGANWCSWCHVLHDTLVSDKALAKTMQYEYELVLIDIDTVEGAKQNQKHNQKIIDRYGNPTKNGIPAWVILDADGKQVATINTEPMELGKGYDTAKVMATLKQWKAKPVAAEAVLANALTRAKSDDKNVFVHFSAPWCSYCKRLDAFLQDEKVAPLFGRSFIPVKVDVERMTGGHDMATRYGRREEDGTPYFAILDSTGKKLADAHAKAGNVGFPVEPHEVAHFMKVVGETGKSLAKSDLSAIEGGLRRFK